MWSYIAGVYRSERQSCRSVGWAEPEFPCVLSSQRKVLDGSDRSGLSYFQSGAWDWQRGMWDWPRSTQLRPALIRIPRVAPKPAARRGRRAHFKVTCRCGFHPCEPNNKVKKSRALAESAERCTQWEAFKLTGVSIVMVNTKDKVTLRHRSGWNGSGEKNKKKAEKSWNVWCYSSNLSITRNYIHSWSLWAAAAVLLTYCWFVLPDIYSELNAKKIKNKNIGFYIHIIEGRPYCVTSVPPK